MTAAVHRGQHHAGTWSPRRHGGWVGRHRRGERDVTPEDRLVMVAWWDHLGYARRMARQEFLDVWSLRLLGVADAVAASVVVLCAIALTTIGVMT